MSMSMLGVCFPQRPAEGSQFQKGAGTVTGNVFADEATGRDDFTASSIPVGTSAAAGGGGGGSSSSRASPAYSRPGVVSGGGVGGAAQLLSAQHCPHGNGCAREPEGCRPWKRYAPSCVGSEPGRSLLSNHFVSKNYGLGIDMDTAGTDYCLSRSGTDTSIYLHENSSIQVWTQAIILAQPEDDHLDVFYHYTSPETFHDITSAPFLNESLWQLMEQQCQPFSPCIYLSAFEPSQLFKDGLKQSTSSSRPPGAALSGHCIALVVGSGLVRDVTQSWAASNSDRAAEADNNAVAQEDRVSSRRQVGQVWALPAEGKETLIQLSIANNEQRFRRIVRACEIDSGREHPDTLDMVSYLAYLLDARGAHGEAEPLYRQALAGYRKCFGDRHPSTLRSMSNLAALLQAQNKLEEAEPLARKALLESEEVFGPNDADTITSVNNMAFLYKAKGAYSDAEELLRRCLAFREANLGACHSETLETLGNLAALLELQEKLEPAELFVSQAIERLEMDRRVCTAGMVDGMALPLLDLLSRLAGILLKQERPEDAWPVALRVLHGCESNFGAEHRRTTAAALQVGQIAERIGDIEAAIIAYRKAWAGKRVVDGADHHETIDCAMRLAKLLHSRRLLSEVEVIYRQSLQLESGKEQPDRALVVRILWGLCVVLEEQQKYGNAESVCRLLLSNCEELYGVDHPSTLQSLHALAHTLDCQDKLAAAEKCYRRCLEGRELLLGASHPDTVDTLQSLACLLNAAGKLTEADPIFHRVLTRRLQMQSQQALAIQNHAAKHTLQQNATTPGGTRSSSASGNGRTRLETHTGPDDAPALRAAVAAAAKGLPTQPVVPGEGRPAETISEASHYLGAKARMGIPASLPVLPGAESFLLPSNITAVQAGSHLLSGTSAWSAGRTSPAATAPTAATGTASAMAASKLPAAAAVAAAGAAPAPRPGPAPTKPAAAAAAVEGKPQVIEGLDFQYPSSETQAFGTNVTSTPGSESNTVPSPTGAPAHSSSSACAAVELAVAAAEASPASELSAPGMMADHDMADIRTLPATAIAMATGNEELHSEDIDRDTMLIADESGLSPRRISERTAIQNKPIPPASAWTLPLKGDSCEEPNDGLATCSDEVDIPQIASSDQSGATGMFPHLRSVAAGGSREAQSLAGRGCSFQPALPGPHAAGSSSSSTSQSVAAASLVDGPSAEAPQQQVPSLATLREDAPQPATPPIPISEPMSAPSTPVTLAAESPTVAATTAAVVGCGNVVDAPAIVEGQPEPEAAATRLQTQQPTHNVIAPKKARSPETACWHGLTQCFPCLGELRDRNVPAVGQAPAFFMPETQQEPQQQEQKENQDPKHINPQTEMEVVDLSLERENVADITMGTPPKAVIGLLEESEAQDSHHQEDEAEPEEEEQASPERETDLYGSQGDWRDEWTRGTVNEEGTLQQERVEAMHPESQAGDASSRWTVFGDHPRHCSSGESLPMSPPMPHRQVTMESEGSFPGPFSASPERVVDLTQDANDVTKLPKSTVFLTNDEDVPVVVGGGRPLSVNLIEV